MHTQLFLAACLHEQTVPQYDDGDEEEFDSREVRTGILLYAKHKKEDNNKR